MNKNIRKLFFGCLATCSLVVFSLDFSISEVKAEDNDAGSQQKPTVVTVATVSIYKAQIVSQDKNNFKISFNFNNQEGVQPQVRYAVMLIKQDEKNQSIVDEKVYDEVLSLGENETVAKNLDYSAPAYLGGTYQLWLKSQNSNGLPLAYASVGEVTLNGDNQFLEVVPGSCFLTVEGDKTDSKYDLYQGVDISQDEKLRATCDVANHFSSAVSFTPQFKTYFRSSFGELVADNNETQPSLSLGAGEKKNLYFILPKAEKPQAYNAVLFLADSNGKTISNETIFHYVLKGVSATIQNLTLDKDFYQKGDTARASFNWSLAADNFPDSRLVPTAMEKANLEVMLQDSSNQPCAEAVQKELESNQRVLALNVAVNKDCSNPKISVTIKDGDNNVLDKQEFAIQSKSGKNKPASGLMNVKGGSVWGAILKSIILVVVVLGVVIVGLVYAKRKTGGLKSILFFVALTAGLFMVSHSASAKTDVFWYGDLGDTTVNYSLDSGTYNANETMRGSFSYSASACGNMVPPRSVYWQVPTRPDVLLGSSNDRFHGGAIIYSYSATQQAPATGGNYNTNFLMTIAGNYYEQSMKKNISVDKVWCIPDMEGGCLPWGPKISVWYYYGRPNYGLLNQACMPDMMAASGTYCERGGSTSAKTYGDTEGGRAWVNIAVNGNVNGRFQDVYVSGVLTGNIDTGEGWEKYDHKGVRNLRLFGKQKFNLEGSMVGQFSGTADTFTPAGNTMDCNCYKFKGFQRELNFSLPFSVTASNNSPSASITSPANGSTFGSGNEVNFLGDGTDPDGDPITPHWYLGGCGANQLSTAWSFSKSDLGVGSQSIFLQACDNKGACSPCQSVTLNINPAPAPTLIFSAVPLTVPAGTSAALNWSVTGARNCTATGGWSGAKSNTGGSEAVSPSSTTTYNLECWNAVGLSSGPKSLTLNVVSCDGTYTQNCGWTSCDKSCGGGQQQKVCQSTLPICGSKIMGTQSCNTQACPGVNANWQESAP